MPDWTKHHGLMLMDPGLDTGFTLLEVLPDEVSMLQKDTIRYDGRSIYKLLREYRESFHPSIEMHFIYEKFTKRPGVVDPELTALKVMGIADLWYQDYTATWVANAEIGELPPRIELVKRLPVEGKNMVKNETLRKLGLHRKGWSSRHINDATRTGVSWLIENRHPWVCETAFPKDDES